MSTETNIAAMPESEEEIAALVSEIAAGLNAIVKSEAANGTPLKKALPPPEGDDEGAEPSADPSASAGPPTDPSAGAPPGGDPGMPADDGAAAGGPPAEGAPGEGGEAGGAPSVEQLVQLYSQLPDEQFEAHFMAIQQVAEQKQGGASPEAGAGAPPPAPAAGPSAGAPPPGGAPMAMSEADKAEMEGLKKSVKLLTDALETVTNAPLRKSVTRYENGIAYIPYQGAVMAPEGKSLKKSFKELTKAEVHEKLKEVTADPKLAKSDRELINGYYSRSVTLDKLEKFFQ